MKGIVCALFVAGSITGWMLPASAQRSSDPNLGHFYMARQQIQILDDAPVVYDKRSVPGSAQVAAPQGPAPLPRAGFSAYSSAMPTMTTGLPEVVNGVPKRIPAPRPSASVRPQKARAGAY